MNDIISSIMKLLNSLDEHQVEYVLIGGFAVAFQGVERFTADVDALQSLLEKRKKK